MTFHNFVLNVLKNSDVFVNEESVLLTCSGGRDNVVSVFDLEEMKKVKTVPVYEVGINIKQV